MGLGTTHRTVTTDANFIPEVWSKEVQKATEAKLVFAKLVMRFDRDVLKFGDTIHVPIVSNLSANDKTAEGEVTLQAATEGKVDISIDKHKEASFLLEDIVDVQSQYDQIKLYQAKGAYAISKAIDTSLATLVASFSQNQGDYNTNTVDDTSIIRAVQYLDDVDAPEDERYFAMKPVLRAAMLKIDKFVRMDYYPKEGDAPVIKGRIGEVYGLTCLVSTNVYKTGDNTSNAIMQKEALALAMQKHLRTQMDYILEYLGTLVVSDAIYGVAEYRDVFGVEIKS